MKLLLFAGAGTSVELGVPAMEGMAIEFLAHAEQWNIEPELVRQILGDKLDIELLLEKLDLICAARQPLETLTSAGASLVPFEKIRAEVEWFVQHAAERVAPPDARLMWGSVLRAAAQHSFTVVTTNYDRAIELAANAERISLADGFDAFTENEVAAWTSLAVQNSAPLIVKLHGSTDWYADSSSGDPLKLRHPMPLFGRGTLRLANGVQLGSSLVLPSREKILNKAPYPRLSQAFLNAADNCELAVFVGSSLRDAHVRKAASEISSTRPVFIVNPLGDLCGIQQAHPIAQPASLFLASTLPAALTSPDPIQSLMTTGSSSPKEGGILDSLRIATDARESTERRCHAIEKLDQRTVALDKRILISLLSDVDRTVSRYSLGLVATSPDRDELLALAKESAHKDDSAFAEELDLLERLQADKPQAS